MNIQSQFNYSNRIMPQIKSSRANNQNVKNNNIHFGHYLGDNIDPYSYDLFKLYAIYNKFNISDNMSNLNSKERTSFAKDVKHSADELVLFLNNKKPSVLLGYNFGEGEEEKRAKHLSTVKKAFPSKDYIVQDAKYNNKNIDDMYLNILVVNKKLTQERIKDNKELFATRLGLDKNTTPAEIIKEIEKPETISSITSNTGKYFEDLLGIMLGFSATDSVIFNLDGIAIDQGKHDFSPQMDKNYVQDLKDTLNDKDSVYKDMSGEFKNKISDKLDDVEYRNGACEYLPFSNGYNSIVFTPKSANQDLDRIDRNIFENYMLMTRIKRPKDRNKFLKDKSVENFIVNDMVNQMMVERYNEKLDIGGILPYNANRS